MPKISTYPVKAVPSNNDQLLGTDSADGSTKQFPISSLPTSVPPDGSVTPAKLSFDPATQVELNAVSTSLSTHLGATNNPHSVTKAQIGLGNVTNVDATQRINHSGPQSADTITDGSVNKVYTVTEKTKLAGIQTSATANDTDANLKNRANHTGTQSATTISDFNEQVRDTIGAALVAGTNVTITPNDGADTITISATGGSGATNLTTSRTSSAVTVLSDTGTDAVLAAADGTNAGVMTSTMQTKLAGIATGATANDTDANLKNRANHTGTQPSSTISDFTTAVDARISAAGVVLAVTIGTPVIGTPTHNSVTITFTSSRVAVGSVVYGTGTVIDTVPPYNYPGSQSETPGGNGTSHSVTLVNLLPSTTYAFRALVVTSNSEAYSDETTFTTAAVPDSTPPVITIGTVTKSSTTITVPWTTDDLADSVLEVRTQSGPGPWVKNPAQEYTLVQTHSMTATGLTPATAYDYRVTSVNAASLSTTSSIGGITTDAAGATTVFDYDFSTTDATKMVPIVGSPGAGIPTTSITGGEGIATLSTGQGSNGFVSTTGFDATNKEIKFHVTKTYSGVGGGPSTRAIVEKSDDITQQVGIIQDNGNIYPFYRKNNNETIDFAQGGTYDQATESWWRIRFDSGTQTVILDTDDNSAFSSPRTVGTFPFATAVDTANWNINNSKAKFQASTYTAGSWGAFGPAKLSQVTVVTSGSAPPPTQSSTYPSTATISTNGSTWQWVSGDDFNIAGGVPEGAWPRAADRTIWGYYDTGWKDSSQMGTYNTPKVNSVVVSGGEHFLRYRPRYEGGQYLVAAPQFLPASNRLNMRFSMRWRSTNLRTYKVAFLTWPQSNIWPRDGEGDFLEGALDSNVEWYMHRQNATSGGDQDHGDSGVKFANTGWHITTMEWIAGVSWRVYLDGVQVGSTITNRVFNVPHRISLQLETRLDGGQMDPSVTGFFDIDWVAFWQKI